MKRIDEDIKNKTFQKVYLLYGEENYLKRQYKMKLKKALVLEGDTMNYLYQEGKDVNPKEIIDLAETLPFFADRRLILMENTGFFKNASDEMAEYVKQIPDSTVLLFVEEEIDKRSKMYKAVQKNGSAIEFTRQSNDILMRWILSKVKKENKNITNAGMQLFLSKTGDDMENIDSELEKLFSFTLRKDTIDEDDVEAICTGQVTNQIFDMVNAISEQNQKKALQLYFDLLALKEPPMRILFLILRQFHILLLIKDLKNKGVDQREIASKVKIPEFAIRRNLAQVREFSFAQLEHAIEDGLQTETNIKTGMMTEQLAVETFLIQYSTKKEPKV